MFKIFYLAKIRKKKKNKAEIMKKMSPIRSKLADIHNFAKISSGRWKKWT